ncbi:MAG: hypothetical protein IH984_08285 [Planctomycetes bacterium]|nr:hypothetical protein [Planctomycetota bacterium]
MPNETDSTFSDDSSATAPQATVTTDTATLEDFIELHRGESLLTKEATEFASGLQANRVVIGGRSDSGKTTLIASIYERFNHGTFAGYLFAGSDTLIGFERICHHSRLVSNRLEPKTERTARAVSHRFLHLRVCKENKGHTHRDLLLSDVSGEEFQAAINSEEDARALSLIRFADHFVVLSDGARLADVSRRQEERRFVKLLILSLIQIEYLDKSSFVDILFTKDDVIERTGDACKDFIKMIEGEIRDSFEKLLGRLRFFSIAARDEKYKRDIADGVDGVLPSWIEDSPLDKNQPSRKLKMPPITGEFDKYFQRILPQAFE